MEIFGFFIFLGLWCIAQSLRGLAREEILRQQRELEEKQAELEQQQPLRRVK